MNYVYLVGLKDLIPDLTTRRGNIHWMRVNAPDRDSAKRIAKESARRRAGIDLRDEDFVNVSGGKREA